MDQSERKESYYDIRIFGILSLTRKGKLTNLTVYHDMLNCWKSTKRETKGNRSFEQSVIHATLYCSLDCMTIAAIAQASKDDPTLVKIGELINQSLTWIQKKETIEVQRFKNI